MPWWIGLTAWLMAATLAIAAVVVVAVAFVTIAVMGAIWQVILWLASWSRSASGKSPRPARKRRLRFRRSVPDAPIVVRRYR